MLTPYPSVLLVIFWAVAYGLARLWSWNIGRARMARLAEVAGYAVGEDRRQALVAQTHAEYDLHAEPIGRYHRLLTLKN